NIEHPKHGLCISVESATKSLKISENDFHRRRKRAHPAIIENGHWAPVFAFQAGPLYLPKKAIPERAEIISTEDGKGYAKWEDKRGTAYTVLVPQGQEDGGGDAPRWFACRKHLKDTENWEAALKKAGTLLEKPDLADKTPINAVELFERLKDEFPEKF